jgi:hypothetical protein
LRGHGVIYQDIIHHRTNGHSLAPNGFPAQNLLFEGQNLSLILPSY